MCMLKPQGHPFAPMPDLQSASGIWPPLTKFSATLWVQNTITSPLARSMQSSLNSPCVMVNFMCPLDWALGPRYSIKHFSGCVYDSVSGWDLHLNHRLNIAHIPPRCGWASSNALEARIEQKRLSKGEFQLSATEHVIGLLLTVELDLGPLACDRRLGLLNFHNCVSQFLIISKHIKE